MACLIRQCFLFPKRQLTLAALRFFNNSFLLHNQSFCRVVFWPPIIACMIWVRRIKVWGFCSPDIFIYFYLFAFTLHTHIVFLGNGKNRVWNLFSLGKIYCQGQQMESGSVKGRVIPMIPINYFLWICQPCWVTCHLPPAEGLRTVAGGGRKCNVKAGADGFGKTLCVLVRFWSHILWYRYALV